MPQDPSPIPPRRLVWAHALYAAAIWCLVAYSLWGPKPPPASFTLASACPR